VRRKGIIIHKVGGTWAHDLSFFCAGRLSGENDGGASTRAKGRAARGTGHGCQSQGGGTMLYSGGTAQKNDGKTPVEGHSMINEADVTRQELRLL